MGSILLRIGIIAAIGGGFWIFRDRLPSAAGDVQVGDCFDAPTTVDETVDDVSHHPCTDPHTAEVIFVGDYPESATYPGVDAFDAFTEANCIPAFNTYTGLDFETALDYDMGIFYPLEEAWGADREITCYVVRSDESKMSQSIKKAQ